jgi:hypothetical protein
MFWLLAAAHAASVPWPTDRPLVYRFTYGNTAIFANSLGAVEAFGAIPVPYTWTCRAHPPKRNGRQEMTCNEPGVGDIWLLFGPDRVLIDLDISEDNASPEGTFYQHRMPILASALELWPPAAGVGKTWVQGGAQRLMHVATVKGGGAFEIVHTVATVEGARVTITSTGTGTLLYSSSAQTDRYLGLVAKGEGVVDTGTGVVVSRTFTVEPTRADADTYGPMGHVVTVELVEGR